MGQGIVSVIVRGALYAYSATKKQRNILHHLQMFNMFTTFTILIIVQAVKIVTCSIGGLSYMDPINMRRLPPYQQGEDPCNPLYWYPKSIPEYCNYKNFPIASKPPIPPIPMPLPVPMPHLPPMIPPPPPLFHVVPPLPYGVPIVPTNPMVPVAPSVIRSDPYPAPMYPSIPLPNTAYSNHPQQIGMVPGLPGLVTRDGGISILPFSDAYSDLIETHKNRMIRKRLHKLIEEYKHFPNARSYRRLRKYLY